MPGAACRGRLQPPCGHPSSPPPGPLGSAPCLYKGVSLGHGPSFCHASFLLVVVKYTYPEICPLNHF